VHLEQNVPLAPFTTLRIGGLARYLARITSEAALVEAIYFAREQNLPIYTLGGGSNVVIPDEGYPGVVLKIDIPEQIELTRTEGAIEARVSAGTDWNALVLYLCEKGIAGMECLAGIPGLVGGAPIQNIGAYGQEVSQTIASVRALDLQTLAFISLSKEDCGFAYRTSIFNSTHRNHYIVTQVSFRLDPAARANLTYADLRKHFGPESQPTPLEVYEAVRKIRAAKGMLIDPAHPSPDTRSAGSFFKNPIVPARKLAHIAQILGIPEAEIPHWPAGPGQIKLPAAWLIERAGFPKGFVQSPSSPVGISTRHTLALINRSGTATYRDLQQLAALITIQVEYHLNVSLEQEPVTLT
jgi:UDP-N-acetylmuramate dehydrogenase